MGQLIRERRLAKGWSQTRAAAEARVSQPWLSAVENGKASAEIGLVFRLMRRLDMVIDITDVDSLQKPRDGIDIDDIVEPPGPGGMR